MNRFVFALIFFGVGIGSCTKPDVKPVITGKEGENLPIFNILLSDSTSFFNTAEFDAGKPIVLFYFSPGCPYCRMETRRIVNNISKFKDVQFCLVTNGDFEELRGFCKLFDLDKHKNIIMVPEKRSGI
ncbi:hypothetical protein [Chitinophaga sp. MM2321]|uniref:hypothetical protein n=1 Tax=Chitinophaga sp. MM2321 TaxID=3137178 RepID=UPI0032D59268